MNSRDPTSSISPAVVFLSIVLVFQAIPSAAVTDNLLPGQSISGNKTLTSKSGIFELGSFASTFYEQHYLGVRYKNLGERSPAFRIGAYQFPDTSFFNATLHFLRDRLYIENLGSEFIRWSSNSTAHESAASVAILLDTGNFVVRDEVNPSMIIWQSFDYPCDALLPGAWLRNGLQIYDPPFSCSLYTDEEYRGNFSIDTGYHVHGEGLPGDFSSYSGKFPDGMFTYNKEGKGGGSQHLNFPRYHNDIEVLKLELGMVSLLRWSGNDTAGSWQTMWSSPPTCHGNTFFCGAFAACTQAGKCRCIHGFQPKRADEWELGRFTSGCSSIHPLNCEDVTTTDSFVLLDSLDTFPAERAQYMPVTSIGECKSACLRNCNCTAYSYSSLCYIWNDNLHGLRLSAHPHYSIYVRVRSAVKKGMRTQEIVALVIGLVLVAIIIVTGSLFLWIYKRPASRRIHVQGFLASYSYPQLKKATRNFSEKLGEGGFGSVFKGVIAGPTLVAVKQLKGLGYGDKQFRTEVQTIGMIQKTNLVRLWGFCAEGTRRLLVYEYMPNGSLDAHLFSDNSGVLSWDLRYRIALGIAKGLAYLHEECNDCIIHCDIKPENILLDAEFCPKIADFGMAKLLRRGHNTALTTFRGTIGYLAPEWLSGQPVTYKVDVYSFGIVLLEIISGRRVTTAKMRFGNHCYFPGYAATQVNEGEVLSLLDGRLEGNATVKEFQVACRVACWCIQDDENQRPSMGQVVRMLQGVVYPQVPPIPASFEYLMMGYDDSDIYSAQEHGFRNEC